MSRASAGEMLRQLAASGWMVELTGSRTHRAYVPRDLAELGVDVQPARLRPAPGREVEEETFVVPPLPRLPSARRRSRSIIRRYFRAAAGRKPDRGVACRYAPRRPGWRWREKIAATYRAGHLVPHHAHRRPPPAHSRPAPLCCALTHPMCRTLAVAPIDLHPGLITIGSAWRLHRNPWP